MPARRKIDDQKLMELFNKGQTLKRIGKVLGVSAVAIHKRIKRLRLLKLPRSLENLTPKERRFVLAVAEGKSRTKAVMEAYNVNGKNSTKALQTTLMKNPEIQTALNDLMEMEGVGRQFRVRRLAEFMQHSDPVIALKSLDMGFKLAGDEKEGKSEEKPQIIVEVVNYARQGYCRKCEEGERD